MSAPLSTRPNLRVKNDSPPQRSRALALTPHPAIALALIAALLSAVSAVRTTHAAPALRLETNYTSASVATTEPTRTMYTSPSGGLSSARVYRATTYVKAVGRTTIARLQVRQVQNGQVVASRLVSIYAYTNRTRSMIASLQPKAGGGYLEVRVRASGTSYARASFTNLRVASYSPSYVAAPSCTSDIKGIPAAGTAYAGQTASGTVSLSSRESSYGRKVAVHRIYATYNGIDGAARTAASDVANKRVPWISFTVPSSWANMAAGRYDSWVLSVISKLNVIKGPVWLVFAHEPEHHRGEQKVTDWVRMQSRLLGMVKAHSHNIATSIILEGYWQVAKTDRTLTLDALWPGDGKVDVIGMDSYNFYGTKTSSGKTFTDMTDLRPWFKVFHDFAAAHHTHWGVAETGYTDAAARKDLSWITTTYSYLKSYGGVAMSYFDTSYNTGGFSWQLNPTAKRAQWGKAIRLSARMC